MASPYMVLGEGTQTEKGESARMSSFVGATALTDMVKTTLGPKGMDKILQSAGKGGDVTITNDGATILKAVAIDNPAAKILVDISKGVDDEIGDGTTSVCVLAGELLREAEKLVAKRIHPQTIIAGWRAAVDVAKPALQASSEDHSENPEVFREVLMNIARTTLSSKLLTHEKDHFAKLAVDAVMRLKSSGNLDHIQIIKKPGGNLRDSYLEEGFLLDKKIGVGQPKRIENAKILIANTAMDTDKIKIYGSRVKVDSLTKVADIETAEKEKMKKKVEKICDHGINVFINRQLIYNYPEQLFAARGVMAIEHADFEGVERLSAVLGGEVASTFDHPEMCKLGHADLIEEIMIGEDQLIRFSGVSDGSACTIVLRGSSTHILEEADRSLHDALCILVTAVKSNRIVYGGGASETLMANAIDQEAMKTVGKKALAMEAFAKALRQLPAIISENAGLDSADIVAQLRAFHSDGKIRSGINIKTGKVGNMQELGICEPLKSKLQILTSAAEAAEMILRVDDIVKAPPRQRDGMMG